MKECENVPLNVNLCKSMYICVLTLLIQCYLHVLASLI